MFVFDETEINAIALHRVGNKVKEEDLILSENLLQLPEEMNEILKTWFLSSFKSEAYYNLKIDGEVPNFLFREIKPLFDGTGDFFEASKNIARFLFDQTHHSQIKSGDLFMVYFTNCVVDDELCDAIGLFKAENKDIFIQIKPDSNLFSVEANEGINIHKLDKGALIFNTEEEFGYKISLVDKVNKIEAQYWRENFLHVQERNDEFYQTQSYLDMCKGFVEQVYNQENNVERTEQIEMLNKSAEYFTEKEAFNIEEFENEVIKEPEIVNAFEEYKQLFEEQHELQMEPEFAISKEAVKKNKRKFKSVLKLDKNFHIYIHGDRNRIEKGFDNQKNMNYYKVYFETEE